jgi:hypothetical protein
LRLIISLKRRHCILPCFTCDVEPKNIVTDRLSDVAPKNITMIQINIVTDRLSDVAPKNITMIQILILNDSDLDS